MNTHLPLCAFAALLTAYLVIDDYPSGETGEAARRFLLRSAGHETAYAVATQPLTENVLVVGQAENVAPDERGRLGGRTVGPSDALVARFEPGLCGARAARQDPPAPGPGLVYRM